MHNTIESLFPTTIRLNRQKNDFDRFVLPLSLALAGAYFAYSYLMLDMSAFSAIAASLEKAVLSYMTYLIMIELSPDSINMYLPSFLITGLSIVPLREVHIMTTVFFLFTLRLLTKSSGYRSSSVELAFMTVFTVLEYFLSPFIYPLFFGSALLLDYRFKPDDRRNMPFIAVSFFMALLWLFRGFGVMTSSLDPFSTLMVCLTAIAYILRLSLLKSILTMNDLRTGLISPRRVKAAALLLLISLIILAVGHAMVFEFLNLWVMTACVSFPFLKDIRRVING